MDLGAMNRLKLTLENGKEFLSPFVYTDAQAQRRMRSMRWLLKKGCKPKAKIIHTLEIVEADKFPSIAPYNEQNVYPDYVRFLELMWDKLYEKEVMKNDTTKQ